MAPESGAERWGLDVSTKRTCDQLKLSDRVAELLRISKLATVFEGYGEYL